VQGLANIRVGVDKTASELAIVRLTQEIHYVLKELGDLPLLPTSNNPGCTILFVCLSIPIFLMAAVYLLGYPGSDGSMVAGMLGFTGSFLLLIAFYLWSRGQEQQKQNIEINISKQGIRSNLQKELVQKMNELKRHQKLVDG